MIAIVRRAFASRWRRVALAVVAIVGVVVAVGVIVASGGSPSSGGGNARAGAALVARRNLVATDTESGTLGYAASETVYDRLSGTVTSLPAVGEVIRQGQTLFRVDDTPVVLFDGGTPAYRVLSPSDRAGPDILELNRDLKALGFDSGDQIVADDVWQSATTAAVDLWQGSLGLAETGSIPLGRIVFLPGAQRVTAVNTVLGSTGQSAASGSSASGSGAGGSTATPVVGRAELVRFTTTTTSTLTTTPKAATGTGRKPAAGRSGDQSGPSGGGSPTAGGSGDSAAILAALKAPLKAEAARLKNSKSSASSGSGSGGSKGSGSKASGSGGGAAAQPILETASTKLVVSVALDASKRSEAVVGERVSVEMPDGSTVNGRVTQVSSVAQASSSSNSNSNSNAGGGSGAPSATVPVTVALTGHHRSLAGLDQAAVSVNFVQQQARHVLSVPVTALLATAGGGYDVQQAAAPHRLIAVTPGLFAAGYVQISGSGIYAGLQVTDSQG